MRIKRELLLTELEAVLPGLSPREIIEQSSCFVFRKGKVMTYNDEIACTHKSSLDIKGAVQADPLVAILRKLEEDYIDVLINEGELLIKGKRRRAGIRMDAKILLPIKSVERPKKWMALPEDFADAISIVQHCSGSDDSQFPLTCIHIHPEWIEACDNQQVSRYKIRTDIGQSMLVRKDALKHIISLGMNEFSETENWIHFRNPTELVLSCRRYVEKYPSASITEVLKIKGEPTGFPKTIKAALERAEIFSAENIDDNRVVIKLSPKKVKITGKGTSGWFSEIKQAKYKGKPVSFTIAPKLLERLVQEHSECQITSERLKVAVGKFVYVTCLGEVKD